MGSVSIQEIINQLGSFLTEYLKSELEGEKRKAIDSIDCAIDNEYRYTECCTLTNREQDEVAEETAEDLIDWYGGYSVPKGVRIPVLVSWYPNKVNDVTSICVKSYWDKIQFEEGE